MRWKDVLSESVLEKEGKSEQEKPKATRGASLQPAARGGGGGRQGAVALVTPAGLRKGQHPCTLCQPGHLLLPAWLWELLSPRVAPGANPMGRGRREGSSTPFCNALAGTPLGKAAIPVVRIGLVQHKLLVALPGKIAPEAQEGVDVDAVHVASVLHITAQVEFRQQALSSLLLGVQRGP